MLREKSTRDITKTALSRREKLLLAGLGATGLAIPSIASFTRDAGQSAGTDTEILANQEGNIKHLYDKANTMIERDSPVQAAMRVLNKQPLDLKSGLERKLGPVFESHENNVNALADLHERSPSAAAYGHLEQKGYGPISHFENIIREIRGS